MPQLGRLSIACSKPKCIGNALCQTKMTEPSCQNVSDHTRTPSTATPSPCLIPLMQIGPAITVGDRCWLPTSGLRPRLQPATIHDENMVQNTVQKHRQATCTVNACFVSFSMRVCSKGSDSCATKWVHWQLTPTLHLPGAGCHKTVPMHSLNNRAPLSGHCKILVLLFSHH